MKDPKLLLKIEKVLENNLSDWIKDETLLKNFHGVKVDIYNTDYGMNCHITIVTKKPFTEKISKIIDRISFDLKKEVKTLFPDMFKGGINVSTTAKETYDNTKWWYDEKKRIEESISSVSNLKLKNFFC